MLHTSLRNAALAATLAFGLATPALAQSTDAAGSGASAPVQNDTDRMHDAWNDLLEIEGQVVTPVQFVALNNLAFQAAAVRVCDKYTLDNETFGKSLADILSTTDKELTQEQVYERSTAILISFGARFGLFLAEGNGDKDDFCESVANFKASPGEVPLFLK